MKYILTELGFRVLNGVILYIGLNSILYFTFAFQLDFLTAKLTNYSYDFCFESFDWQWVPTSKSGSTEFEELLNLSTSVHQSKSWSFLNLASMSYLNEFIFHSNYLVVLNRIFFHLIVIIYILIQMYGFLLTGWLSQSRQIGLFGLVLILGYVFGIHPTLALYICAHFEELNIEPLDSELRILY